MFPLVPDVQLLQDSSYSQSKSYVYKEQGVKVSRTAKITEEVVIGKGSFVGDNTLVTRSIIGREVQIGNNCVISDAHIWDGKFNCSHCQLQLTFIIRCNY